jgi:hypothetical protein
MAKKKTTINKNIKPTYQFTSKAEFYSAFRYRNLVFYGGPADNLGISLPWDVVIKLDKFSDLSFPKVTVPEGDIFKNLNSIVTSFNCVPVVEITWPDGGIPNLPKTAWQAIVKDLVALSESCSGKDLEIAVCCRGGHGRTGTALAILKSMLLDEVMDPVASIRKTYLPESVETIRQIEYVSYITGKEVKEKSSYSNKSYGSSSYYTTGAGTYNKTDDKFDDKKEASKTSDLGSVAVKANEKSTYGNRYPRHKAQDCTGKNCPDKDSSLLIHCAKNPTTTTSKIKEVLL